MSGVIPADAEYAEGALLPNEFAASKRIAMFKMLGETGQPLRLICELTANGTESEQRLAGLVHLYDFNRVGTFFTCNGHDDHSCTAFALTPFFGTCETFSTSEGQRVHASNASGSSLPGVHACTAEILQCAGTSLPTCLHPSSDDEHVSAYTVTNVQL